MKRALGTITASEMGRKGGPARAKSLTKAQRRQIAQVGAAARWKKYYAENPDRKEA